MYGSHDMRHTGFRRLTVVNGTLGFWGVTGTHGSSTKSICYHVCLSRMIFNGTFIILDQFNPSPLSHVQFLLRKQILQALMICKNPTGHSI